MRTAPAQDQVAAARQNLPVAQKTLETPLCARLGQQDPGVSSCSSPSRSMAEAHPAEKMQMLARSKPEPPAPFAVFRCPPLRRISGAIRYGRSENEAG
eukprot:COSAG05_NODE_786_length_7335_cov_1255.905058_4_plen_98_part_00